MSERQRPTVEQNVFPHFDLIPHPLELVTHGLARAIRSVPELFKMHQLASHGDHLPSGVDEMLLGDEGQPYFYPEQVDGREN